MKLRDGSILIHGTAPYDPVKAHAYYIRTRHLKGRHKNGTRSIYTVTTNGRTHVLTQQQLIEEQVYAEHRINVIKEKLSELSSKLSKLLSEAKSKETTASAKPTQAEKAKATRQALLYSRAHKTQIAQKAKIRRQTQPKQSAATPKDPVAELENKINEVKNRLQAAVATQRALLSATKNG